MADSRHRRLDSATGPFFVRLIEVAGQSPEIETGWFEMLEHAGPRGRGVASLGPEDPDLLPDVCGRILGAMTGETVEFADVPLPAGTPFQRAIWRATREIPAGRTRTYGDLAAEVGRPGAARAVGQAMRRNPQPIITPCHRVVGSCGLGGFGGHGPAGVWPGIKARLLVAEGVSEARHPADATSSRRPTARTCGSERGDRVS
jgi:methylated-DNA-[protein]-cysteine S-methyltransferase